MKGLLIKDLRLMKGQKTFFLSVFLIAVVVTAMDNNPDFLLAYLPFVFSFFTLSTISYDEFDNGNPFLFTLPITRTDYAAEKYLFSLLVSTGTLLLASLCSVLIWIIKKNCAVSELLLTAGIILPLLILAQSLMIPIQLKFGGEKGRFVMFGVFALICGIGLAAGKAAELFGVDLLQLLDTILTLHAGITISVMIAAAGLLLLLSLRISIGIMNKKEF